ncbi:MAG: 4Fe-4S dicluster domain-containing protein [Bacteroidales bacterium]
MREDFGFEIYVEKRVTIDRSKGNLFEKLSQIEPDILNCIGCGSCSATCSAALFTGCSFREAILLLERDMENEAKMLLSPCMLCGKCTIVCPRGINCRAIIFNLLKS